MLAFPFLHVIALMTGGFLILVIKKKYQKLYKTEALLIFILYALLIALYTEPVITLIKNSID
ncbi:MAG: hypothetical protein FJ139_05640 [Deltaproteobacteria bacterium]|nr:hypothetical protein [Deltaproteobacteria bacterium]